MTAAVAVMSASGASMAPKRHGFSIESLIGTPEAAPPSAPRAATPPRIFSLRQIAIKESSQEDRHNEWERDRLYREIDRDRHRDRERDAVKEREACALGNRQCREIERESDLFRERELILEHLRLRDRELSDMRDRELRDIKDRELRDIKDRELRDIKDREVSKERETYEFRESRNGRHSAPHHQRVSSGSASPASPRTDHSLTPQSENRVGLWAGEEFKHILGSLNSGHFDPSGHYQPLRVCNRTLASMGSIPGIGAPPAAMGIGIPPHFSHLQMNPLLYNLARDLSPQPHPLLAGRFPGFINTRYQMGPPAGLLFHPYRKPKRNRTAFSPAQLLHLEQAFEKNHYVVGQERKSLATKLQLTETQVKVWFQNRRTKHKRMKAEEDGGCSRSQADSHDGCAEKGRDRSDLAAYAEHEDDDDEDLCTDVEAEEEEELSVTEEC